MPSRNPRRAWGEMRALDIVSYGRRGPARPERFSPAQIEQLSRTVRGAPEVMVKVSGGARTARGVAAHLAYISREGELDLETDEGERLAGKDIGWWLASDWDLDLEPSHHRKGSEVVGRRVGPKLVHNLILSMPAGTAPERVHRAAQTFAREEFGAKHPYAMALHTDEPHPHVHLVVRARDREGRRLNVRKANLRTWRERFAEKLRAQGIEANATPAALRGRLKSEGRADFHRLTARGTSYVHFRQEYEDRLARANGQKVEPGLGRIIETAECARGEWYEAGRIAHAQGLMQLGDEIERFRQELRVPRTRLEEQARKERACERGRGTARVNERW